MTNFSFSIFPRENVTTFSNFSKLFSENFARLECFFEALMMGKNGFTKVTLVASYKTKRVKFSYPSITIYLSKSALRIRIRMYLDLSDMLVRDTGPDPDPSIIKQNIKKP